MQAPADVYSSDVVGEALGYLMSSVLSTMHSMMEKDICKGYKTKGLEIELR